MPMEKLTVEVHYKPGTRLYKVVNGELNAYDVEEIKIGFNRLGLGYIEYTLRINESSTTVEASDGKISKFYLTPEEAILENSQEIFERFNKKNLWKNISEN